MELPFAQQENFMAATSPTQQSDTSTEDTTLATPDGPGPHDVPDSEVIEKTLPTGPVELPGT